MRIETAGTARGADRQAPAFGDALARARRRDPSSLPRLLAATSGEAPGAPSPGPDLAPPRAGEGRAPAKGAVAELAAVARVLPPVIATARAAGGAHLALSFGRSLEVELRATAAGVELVLRPEPRLARAAEIELPRIVAALRARGVAVARAEVRRSPGGARRAR